MIEDRDLLFSILHLRLFFFQRSPNSLRRKRGLTNAHTDGAIDGIGDVGRHRIQRGFTAALGAVGTDTILVLHEMQFDLFR